MKDDVGYTLRERLKARWRRLLDRLHGDAEQNERGVNKGEVGTDEGYKTL